MIKNCDLFSHHLKLPSSYIPTVNDGLAFIYNTVFIINYIRDICFQNLAELCISLFYAVGVIITACHETGNTAKLSCKFKILQ